MKTSLPAALLATALLVGCNAIAGPNAAAPAGPASVSGRTFLSTAVARDGRPVDLVPGTSVRLVFDADGNLGAQAGCNHIGGSYAVDGGRLRFEGGGMTEMGCDEPRHQQDEWLATFLASDPMLRLEGDHLELSDGEWTLRLSDREVVEPDLALVGPLWTVGSLIGGDAVSSVPGEAKATIRFLADGRVAIQSGCNEAGGSYTVEGERLALRDLVSTDMACQGGPGQLEAAVMSVLQAGNLEWSIEASSLTLRAGDTGLMLSAAGE